MSAYKDRERKKKTKKTGTIRMRGIDKMNNIVHVVPNLNSDVQV